VRVRRFDLILATLPSRAYTNAAVDPNGSFSTPIIHSSLFSAITSFLSTIPKALFRTFGVFILLLAFISSLSR
jgi:hypothetical protein